MTAAALIQQQAYAVFHAKYSHPEPVHTSDDWRLSLIERAQLEIGKPYSGPIVKQPDSWRWGDPGWDCSSFVVGQARAELGLGPPLAYTDDIYDHCFAPTQPLAGDVVFYHYYDPAQPNTVYPHMGLWLNERQTLDCRFPQGCGVHPHLPFGTLEVRTLEAYLAVHGFRAAQVAPIFFGGTQPIHVWQSWPAIAQALQDRGILDTPTAIAALATLRVENYYHLRPVREGISYAGAEANYGYQTRTGQQLGNVQPGDGWNYRGGGWVQLTGGNNYRRLRDVTGVDVVSFPDLILQPDVAAAAFALYFAEHDLQGLANEAFYGGPLEREGWVNTRRAVNGWVPVPNGLSDYLQYVAGLRSILAA